MKKTFFYPLISILLLSASCRETAYLSPLNNVSHYYQTIPLHSDSVKAATYINTILTSGSANNGLEDNIFGFHTGISRSMNFGYGQAYVGANVTLGNYQLRKQENNYTNIDNKFYGAAGFNGGADIVMPFDHGEWRIIGIETSLQNEFGDYLQFRKSIMDTTALLVQKSDWTNTIGVYTEFAWKVSRHGIFGYKLASGGTFISPQKYFGTERGRAPHYFSNTIRFTENNLTGFLQMTAGTYAFALQLGMNINISKHRKIDQ